MAQLKVKDLLNLCKEAVKNGNGFHGLFYGFSPTEGFENEIYDSITKSANDTIILG